MAASVGADVGLYYDARVEVEEGDVIRTTAGRCYRVLHARQQQRGKHEGRWHLRALVIDPGDVSEDDTVHPLHWYRRVPGMQAVR